jgi:hypothetical protein
MIGVIRIADEKVAELCAVKDDLTRFQSDLTISFSLF